MIWDSAALKFSWFYIQLKTDSFDLNFNWLQLQTIWISTIVSDWTDLKFMWFEARMLVSNPTDLKFKWVEIQFDSVGLRWKGIRILMNWKLASFKMQIWFELERMSDPADFKFHWAEIQLIWGSSGLWPIGLTFNFFENQLTWNSFHLGFKYGLQTRWIWNSNDLRSSWFEIHLMSQSIELKSKSWRVNCLPTAWR